MLKLNTFHFDCALIYSLIHIQNGQVCVVLNSFLTKNSNFMEISRDLCILLALAKRARLDQFFQAKFTVSQN